MNAISRIASLLTLAALARAEHHEDSDDHDAHMDVLENIEIIATWNSLLAGLYVAPESVEYNGDDNVWYLNNWFADNSTDTPVDKVGEISTLSGNYPVTTSTDFDFQDNIMDVKAAFPGGMVYSDGYLFVTDFVLGGVHKFDTNSSSYVAMATTGAIANGLCMDDDTGMLYSTSTGVDFDGSLTGTAGTPIPALSGLWSIDPDTLVAERLYNGAASQFPEGFVMAPNGCYVNDGQVFLVNMAYEDDATGYLGIYDIDSGNFSGDAEVLADHPRCDGIVYYDGFWFVSDVAAGQLLALNTAETDAVFEVVLDNVPGAADICLGPDNTIAIPSPELGTVWFAQFEIGHDHDDSSDENSAAAHIGVFGAFAIIAAALY